MAGHCAVNLEQMALPFLNVYTEGRRHPKKQSSAEASKADPLPDAGAPPASGDRVCRAGDEGEVPGAGLCLAIWRLASNVLQQAAQGQAAALVTPPWIRHLMEACTVHRHNVLTLCDREVRVRTMADGRLLHSSGAAE